MQSFYRGFKAVVEVRITVTLTNSGEKRRRKKLVAGNVDPIASAEQNVVETTLATVNKPDAHLVAHWLR
jgi:hypothetical protein